VRHRRSLALEKGFFPKENVYMKDIKAAKWNKLKNAIWGEYERLWADNQRKRKNFLYQKSF
jgi:hypothetical protein